METAIYFVTALIDGARVVISAMPERDDVAPGDPHGTATLAKERAAYYRANAAKLGVCDVHLCRATGERSDALAANFKANRGLVVAARRAARRRFGAVRSGGGYYGRKRMC